jgi:TolB-like protein/cytochrome c-type biogenesis protein CcmH/NrfG
MAAPLDPPISLPDYELLRLIGSGSYGEVWLARGVTGLYRAIKIVRRSRFADGQPFEREFKGLTEFAAASGEGGHLALLHVGLNDAQGFFYYVMELADDAVLGRHVDPARYVPLTLSELRARRGRIPAQECVSLGIDLARSLAGLHLRGLVHRDVKPSNVILVAGVAKLADVGLVARSVEANTFVGTEGFVPPDGPGTPAADVFAAGRVLYELATGLDNSEFPSLPPGVERFRDRRALLKLNEVIVRAGDPAINRRYRDAGALLGDLEALQEGRRDGPQRLRRNIALALLIAACAAAALLLWHRRRPSAPAGDSDVKSIAVLPFENLSRNAADAYMADGIREEVLTQLTLLRNLRVVAGNTMQRFKASTKSAAEIGTEVGAEFVLRGTVERVGTTLHVTGQLIDTHADRNIWATSLTRDQSEAFAVQADLASQVAAALKVAVSPTEKALVERRPTQNAAAYDLYLNARELQADGEFSLEGSTRQVKLLEQALAIDPGFADAWGQLAEVNSWIYFSDLDHTDSRRTKARHAMEMALELGADSPGVIRSAGTFYYYAFRDYGRAEEQYAKLVRLQPNDASVYYWLGLVQRRQGHWAEGTLSFQRAVSLDANSELYRQALVTNLIAMREYAAAQEEGRRLMQLFPENLAHAFFMNLAEFLHNGNKRGWPDYLATLPASQRESKEAQDFSLHWAFQTGDLAEIARLDALRRRDTENFDSATEIEIAAGFSAAGDSHGVEEHLKRPLSRLLEELDQDPTNSNYWRELALMQALLGRIPESERSIQKAIQLMPDSRDAMESGLNHTALAFVLAQGGEKDKAVDELREVLRTPQAGPPSNVHTLRNSPTFASLRGFPRFEALISDPANNAPFPRSDMH